MFLVLLSHFEKISHLVNEDESHALGDKLDEVHEKAVCE